jgi:hypothetical protein
MKDFARRLRTAWVNVSCPQCGYELEFQVLDFMTQVYRLCPGCRQLIHLQEPDGSVSAGLGAVDRSLSNFETTIRKVGR